MGRCRYGNEFVQKGDSLIWIDDGGIILTGGINDIPYIVGVQIADTNEQEFGDFCTGTLISAQWIMTTAYCLRKTFDNHTLKLHFIKKHMNINYLIEDSKYILHPNYSVKPEVNDIALIKLNNALLLNETLQTILLDYEVWPSNNATNKCYVTGFHKNFYNNYNKIHKINVDINETILKCEQCFENDEENLFCIKTMNNNDTLCNGDFGAPLICGGIVVAIAKGVGVCIDDKSSDNYTFPCRTNQINMFTNIYRHARWIQENVEFNTWVYPTYEILFRRVKACSGNVTKAKMSEWFTVIICIMILNSFIS
ncbi:hypothetical protein O3M35_003046 [Rhynocoris fuscipes]|uniref:Peptidase S1 domain-containing protein n=1 Tax=Rhynocoris fuscipes TaxID=488301 RepID=A0AAW1CIS4_9HEMI